MKNTWRTSLIVVVSLAASGLASRLTRPPVSSLTLSMRSAGPPDTSTTKETRLAALLQYGGKERKQPEKEGEPEGTSNIKEMRLAATDTGSESGSSEDRLRGGTACHCTCGHTVVWQREIFEGNVVNQKEHECEEVVCPAVSIPGLVANAECSYVEDIQELTAGTVCRCLCGDQVTWRDRAFYGDVVEKRELECLEEVCPVTNPLPGLRFEAHCRFVPTLFQVRGRRPLAAPAAQGDRGSAPIRGGAAVPVLALATAIAAAPAP